MLEIYLSINGQTEGPYRLEEIRGRLAAKKISYSDLAWHEGLKEWRLVGDMLAAYPAGIAPPPSIPPPPPPIIARQGINPYYLAALIVMAAGLAGMILFSFFAVKAMRPISEGIDYAAQNTAQEHARQIYEVMEQYAIDHHGVYADGKSSTEVFQKLVDGGYIPDPSIFYLPMPGKMEATSKHLKPENVCYDTTGGLTTDSLYDVPMVFSTGFTVTYVAKTDAQRDNSVPAPFDGVAVAYRDSCSFIPALPDGSIIHIISNGFDPGKHVYRQLRP